VDCSSSLAPGLIVRIRKINALAFWEIANACLCVRPEMHLIQSTFTVASQFRGPIVIIRNSTGEEWKTPPTKPNSSA